MSHDNEQRDNEAWDEARARFEQQRQQQGRLPGDRLPDRHDPKWRKVPEEFWR